MWVAKHGIEDGSFTLECSKCQVSLATQRVKFDPLLKLHVELEDNVVTSRELSPTERRERLTAAPRYPERIEIKTTAFKRNPDVVVEVLLRANGICENCRNIVPFNRASDGSPYLEIHHEQPLSEGGGDTVSNTLALCPNCHRGKHFG